MNQPIIVQYRLHICIKDLFLIHVKPYKFDFIAYIDIVKYFYILNEIHT